MIAQTGIIRELETAITHGSSERRTEILRAVTDLFVRGSEHYTDEEIALFDEVMVRLAGEIEFSVRALLADRLAPLVRAPIKILQSLAGDDDIRIAGQVLTQSKCLDDNTLVAHARAKGQAHLLAISQRRTLSEIITDVLIERGNRDVLLSTANNAGAEISKMGFCSLVARSSGDDLLSICVGSRRDIPHDILLTLIAKASDVVRDKLIAQHVHLRNEITEAVETVTDQFRQDALTVGLDYSSPEQLIRSLSEAGRLTDTTIRAIAEEGRFEESIMALAQICGTPPTVVEQAFIHGQAEAILIFAKAGRLSWPTAKALVWLRAKRCGLPIAQVERTMAGFDRLSFATARQILEFYRIRGSSSDLVKL